MTPMTRNSQQIIEDYRSVVAARNVAILRGDFSEAEIHELAREVLLIEWKTAQSDQSLHELVFGEAYDIEPLNPWPD